MIIYADISSLYPTLGEIFEVNPPKDFLGVYPKLCGLLKEFRYKTKYEAIKQKEEGNEQLAKQLKAQDGQYKIFLNTGRYGWLGSQWEKFNYYEGARTITKWGRKVIKKVNEGAREFGGVVLKCDSVTEDTPIYIKHQDGTIDIISIGELHNNIGKGTIDPLRKFDGYNNLKTLTRNGWKKIKYTKKHKTNKVIYRVLTRNGLAKVTGDHSLFQNGNEVKPKNLSVGENIDELPYKEFNSLDNALTEDQAWVLGFMVSDGSASKVKRVGGYSITTALHKSDKDKLLKAKTILNNWGFDFRFYDTMESSGCYRLGSSKSDAYDFFYPLLYDSYTGEKKVPKQILNAKKDVVQSFLKGQMDGDGHVVNRPETVNITTKSYILAAGLQYLSNKIGWYEASIVSIRPDKQNIISTTFSNPHGTLRKKDGVVRKMDTIEYNKEVYDISTEDGTFVGGTGNVLFHNTDGSLIIVPEKYRGSKESETKYIKKIEKYVNGWLWEQIDTEQRIVLEHDGRYKGVVLFDDKSYVLQKYDGTTKIKGNTLTGRSNEKFLLQFVSKSIDHVLNKEPEKIREEYDYWKFRIQEKLMIVNQVKKRQSLNMSLEEYQNKAASEDYSPIAQYEAALQADRPYMSGDVIETWNEEPKPVVKEYKTVPNKTVIPKAASYEVIRLAKNFNGNIYRDHYLSRLEKGAKKFLVVLGLDTFKEMFPDISILKSDRCKFITVYGLENFHERWDDYGWRKKDHKKLSDEDKELFKDYISSGKINKKYEKKLDINK